MPNHLFSARRSDGATVTIYDDLTVESFDGKAMGQLGGAAKDVDLSMPSKIYIALRFLAKMDTKGYRIVKVFGMPCSQHHLPTKLLLEDGGR